MTVLIEMAEQVTFKPKPDKPLWSGVWNLRTQKFTIFENWAIFRFAVVLKKSRPRFRPHFASQIREIFALGFVVFNIVRWRKVNCRTKSSGHLLGSRNWKIVSQRVDEITFSPPNFGDQQDQGDYWITSDGGPNTSQEDRDCFMAPRVPLAIATTFRCLHSVDCNLFSIASSREAHFTHLSPPNKPHFVITFFLYLLSGETLEGPANPSCLLPPWTCESPLRLCFLLSWVRPSQC